jgi:hypothetical protein
MMDPRMMMPTHPMYPMPGMYNGNNNGTGMGSAANDREMGSMPSATPPGSPSQMQQMQPHPYYNMPAPHYPQGYGFYGPGGWYGPGYNMPYPPQPVPNN